MDFEECLREHGPALWRVVASYAPPGPDRDDLAQDVLVAVWQALPRFATQQRAERFLGHLRTLPLGQRQVLALALEGLSHAEIAALVGITPENVAVRLGRARDALRRSLEKEAA